MNVLKNINSNYKIPWEHPSRIKALKCGIVIIILILLLIIDVVFSNGNSDSPLKDDDEKNFVNYLKRYGKVYTDTKERQNRKNAFNQNNFIIKEHNKK